MQTLFLNRTLWFVNSRYFNWPQYPSYTIWEYYFKIREHAANNRLKIGSGVKEPSNIDISGVMIKNNSFGVESMKRIPELNPFGWKKKLTVSSTHFGLGLAPLTIMPPRTIAAGLFLTIIWGSNQFALNEKSKKLYWNVTWISSQKILSLKQILDTCTTRIFHEISINGMHFVDFN